MRSKADETLVIVETLICPLQISHLTLNGLLCNNSIGLNIFSTAAPWQSVSKFIMLKAQRTK